MKSSLYGLLFLATLALSCKGPKDKITVTDNEGNKATIDVSSARKMAEEVNESQDRSAELKKLTPLTLDQLKSLIPEELMGMKRTRFNTSSAMGVSSCNATYEGEDGKELNLEILDCAGELGSTVYNMQFLSLFNFQQEDDNGYQKTVEFQGQKAIEQYRKNNDRYELTFGAGDRFLVHVEGTRTGLDLVKQVAGNLNLETD